jgi:hypothetical protein
MRAVLPSRSHPIVSTGLQLARVWCAGHQIDGAPAIAHAVKVAAKLGQHVPHPTPELLAACLLHDAPEFAPAAGTGDWAAVISGALTPEVTRVVRALYSEHQAVGGPDRPRTPIDDLPVLLASTADKLVSLGSVLGRGRTADDRAAYWAQRAAFLDAVPYFRGFANDADPHLPPTMAAALRLEISRATRVRNAVTRCPRPSCVPSPNSEDGV